MRPSAILNSGEVLLYKPKYYFQWMILSRSSKQKIQWIQLRFDSRQPGGKEASNIQIRKRPAAELLDYNEVSLFLLFLTVSQIHLFFQMWMR